MNAEEKAIQFRDKKLKVCNTLLSEDYKTGYKEGVQHYMEEVGKDIPTELTAENGAKSLLIGEFYEEIQIPNPEYCGCGKCDFCNDERFENEPEYFTQKVYVSWSTIKNIYKKIVENYS